MFSSVQIVPNVTCARGGGNEEQMPKIQGSSTSAILKNKCLQIIKCDLQFPFVTYFNPVELTCLVSEFKDQELSKNMLFIAIAGHEQTK